MEQILKGKVAIVTGSGQGIGKEIALYFGKHGAKVITNNRKPGSSINAFEKTNLAFSDEERKDLETFKGDAKTTADEIRRHGGEATPFFGDISEFETAKSMVQTAIDTYGRIDIIVNNASSNWVGNIMNMDENLFDICINSKLKGTFNMMHHAIPHMKRQGFGRILNSSSDAYVGIQGHAAYGAANAGVVALSKAAAKDLETYGITVNAYTPLAKTRAFINASANYRLQGIPKSIIEAESPAAMKLTAESMVPFLGYLALDEADYITGKLFRLTADGIIGLWSEPTVVNHIQAQKRIWTIKELRTRIPNELFAQKDNDYSNLKIK